MNNTNGNQRAVILDVPFAEKDEAKELGARWDPDIRKWFVPYGVDPRPFEKWMKSGAGVEVERD